MKEGKAVSNSKVVMVNGEVDLSGELRASLTTIEEEGTSTRVGTIVQANGKKYICFEVKSSDEDDRQTELEKKYMPKNVVDYYYHEELTDF